MRHPQFVTPMITEEDSVIFRASPSVERMGTRDWRNLTYDSSIQILNLELDESFLYSLRNFERVNKDADQTASSISEYDSEVMSVNLMDAQRRHFKQRYSRSRHQISHDGNVSTLDILTNTWDNLKDARLVSYLNETNNVERRHTGRNPLDIMVNDTRSSEDRKFGDQLKTSGNLDKQFQRKSHSDSALDLSRTSGLGNQRRQSGTDICLGSKHQRSCDEVNVRKRDFQSIYEEPKLLKPLTETRHESKIGPVTKVKISMLHKETRLRKHWKYGNLRAKATCTEPSPKQRRGSQYFSKQCVLNRNFATFSIDNTSFQALSNENQTLSNFLLANETIPSINSATPVVRSKSDEFAPNLMSDFTCTPTLRSSKPRSIATSDLKEFQCRKTLDFSNSFDEETEQPLGLDNIDCHFNPYETVLNLCTRKPRLGLAIKNSDKPMNLSKDTITDIKRAISKSNRRMNIKTNGTLRVMPKISPASRSPHRKNSTTSRRRTGTSANDLKFRAVFETNV